MAYEVTATRRRPKTFDELADQEFVAATLKNSLMKGQIAHAYLFSGPRGCGKTSAARILARALNCQNPSETPDGKGHNPCGTCPLCIEITRGACMDVLEIDGASNTSVNDVRQIKEEILFPPALCRYKVYIIDEVHMLSNNAFNALLKTIEEPPPNVVFIFATTELQKVPATIRSRCQQFNFRLVSVETLMGLLHDVCGELGCRAEEEALLWIARESTGSCRDAYTLFDQVLSFSEGNIRMAIIREKLGLVGIDELNVFAEACATGDFTRSLSLLDSLLSSGVAIETFITSLAGYFHSMMLLKAGITRDSILGHPAERFSKVVLQKYDASRLERAEDLLFTLYRDMRYSISQRFELENLVSKLCWLERWISPAELGDAVDGARKALNQTPIRATPVNTQVNAKTAAPPDHPEETESLSEEFNRRMAARNKPAEGEPAAPEPQETKTHERQGHGPEVKSVLEVFDGEVINEEMKEDK